MTALTNDHNFYCLIETTGPRAFDGREWVLSPETYKEPLYQCPSVCEYIHVARANRDIKLQVRLIQWLSSRLSVLKGKMLSRFFVCEPKSTMAARANFPMQESGAVFHVLTACQINTPKSLSQSSMARISP